MMETERCDQVVCLGDILGYPFLRGKYENTRNAGECIALLKRNCSHVLLGNHDFFHLQKFPEFPGGLGLSSEWFLLPPDEKTRVSDNRIWNYSDDWPVNLSEKDAAYLSSLPEYVIKQNGEQQFLFSHFVFPNFSGFLTGTESYEKNLRAHFSFAAANNCSISLCGHLHIEGLGICHEPGDGLISRLFNGFMYYSYGERRVKEKPCCITIPALADNGQVNGFAILDTARGTINALSLNTNRRFIL